MSIHPSAVIEKGAKLGNNVQAGPGVFVSANAEIGDGCILGPNCVIHAYASLGADCRVHAGAVIGDTPQDLAFKHVTSYVRIGARCTLREGMTIHRGTKEGTVTSIGDDCLLMSNSHVAHNCNLGNKVILASGALVGGYVQIGDGAFVSGNAVIHQFCRIGRLAIVGGLSAISKDILPFCMTRSGEYNQVVGLNIVGLRRNNFSPADRKAVRECLDVTYKSGLNFSQAVERLSSLAGNPYASEWAAFIADSKRGICKFVEGNSQDE